MKVELDKDVAASLQQAAVLQGLWLDEVGNQVLRSVLKITREDRQEKQLRTSVSPKAADATNSAWYELEIRDGVDVSSPGLYEWIIEGRGSYIGRYKRITRPTREYERNVRNLASGKSYRAVKPDRFRRIHRALHDAITLGRAITLVILENCEEEVIQARERDLINSVAV